MTEAAPGPARRRTTLLAVVLATVTALLAGGLAVGPAGAQEPPDDPVALTTGSLDWGVRASFRTYVGESGITVSDGVTRGAGGTFHWPLESGTYDPATSATLLQFAGRVHFSAHGGALDLAVTRPRVEITDEGGTLLADMSGLTHSGSPFDWPAAELALLDVDAVEPVVEDGTTTWPGVAAALSEAGVEAFAGFYTLGAPLDPVTATYEGPGGKPDLVETWSTPGVPHFAVTGTGLLPEGHQPIKAVPDPGAGIVHVPAYTQGWDEELQDMLPGAVLALDPDSLDVVGRVDLPFTLVQGGAWIDPATHTVFLLPDARGALWAVDWDPATAAYGEPRELGSIPVPLRNGIYDPAHRRFFFQPSGWSSGLWTVTVGEDETLAVEQVGTLQDLFPRSEANMAVDAAGRLVIGTTASPPTDEGDTARVVDVSTTPATITEIEGSWNMERVTLSPSGQLTMTSVTGTSRTYRWDDDTGAFAPVTDRIETLIGASALATHPGTDAVVNFHGSSASQASVYVEGELVQQLDLHGRGGTNQLATVGPDGEMYTGLWLLDDEGLYMPGVLRVEATGVTPSAASDPEPAEVTVPSIDGSTPATFAVEAAGDPAPTVQWQARAGGVGRFADIEGATDATLTVEATAAITGTEYRAVLTNDVGSVATEPATLTVWAPPAVLQEPDDVTVAPGEDAELKVMPTGNPYPEITWQRYAGGFWWNITDDDDGVTVDGGFLTVTDANVDQSGTLFRARLRNDVGTTHTRTATLTVDDPAPGVPRTAVESFVAAALADFLGAEPDDAAVAAGVAQVEARGRAGFLRDLSTSDAWLEAIVDDLYADTLGRDPSPAERAHWVGQLRGGRSVAWVAASFYGSPEYHGAAGGTDEGWLVDLYQAVLGRAPDPDGLAHWSAEVARIGHGGVALRIYQSPESARTRVTGLYQALLGRAPDPGGLAHWSGRVVTGGDLALAVHLAASAEYQERAVTRFP